MSDLFAAIESGDRARVEELLLEGAAPNTVWMPVSQAAEVPELTGCTVLMAAVADQQDAIIEILLHRGADIDLLDNDDMSALMYATSFNMERNLSILKLLLAYGADPNLCGPSGITALNIAAQNLYRKKVALLLEAGAKPKLVDAIYLGDVHLVRQLLQLGVEINLPDYSQLTPLSIAINLATSAHFQRGGREAYQMIQDLLLKSGATLNLLDTIALNDLDRTRALLEAGHDVNTHFYKNDEITPLHRAARMGHLEMVKLLMEYGADVSAEDWDWYTPLSEAENSGHHEIAVLLRAAGAKRQGEVGTEAYRLNNPEDTGD